MKTKYINYVEIHIFYFFQFRDWIPPKLILKKKIFSFLGEIFPIKKHWFLFTICGETLKDCLHDTVKGVVDFQFKWKWA